MDTLLKIIEEEKIRNTGRLHIAGIDFDTLPYEVCSLKNLKSLYIEGNKLDFKIPDELVKLKKIKEIHIHQTGLTKLPIVITEISSLENLCLGGNKIKLIPSQIKKLEKLRRINLSNNKFSKFPLELLQLQSLKEVRLSRNSITTLPKETQNLKNDIHIDLSGNKIPVPKEALSGLSVDVVQYILDFQEASDKKPLKEAKLIFIGSGNVGKTSLINRITKGYYNENEDKTEGIAITDWKLKRKDGELNVHIWDFGGQEIMHTTHKFFMTSRSIYVLVINPRTQDTYSGDNELEYWLKLIRSYASDVPIIIAINKCEVHKANIPKSQIKDKYPNLLGFVETSCKDDIGIDTLVELITSALNKLQFINDKLPKSYFDIKEKLQTKNNDYINYQDFNEICKQVDPNFKETSQFALIRLLHDLGVMLCFNNDRILQDIQVLNPDWVTNGVYQIINYSKLIDSNGILNLQDLPIILDINKYPTDKERYYIADLMEHFELSFKSENNSKTYFIPSAFSKDRPEDFEWNWDDISSLRFNYNYDVLPSSIMSRFIVKSHRLIRNNDFWFSGVVVQSENCEALVMKDSEERTIKISVTGKGNKQALLAIIREKFETIHYSYRDINIKRYLMVDKEGKVPVSYDHLLIYQQQNIEKIYIPELTTEFNVNNLIHNVDTLDKVIQIDKEKEHTMKGVSLFISYSHKDEEYKDKLKSHLSALRREGTIRMWDDRQIKGGNEWEPEIMDRVSTFEFILLLISSDFIDSEFCMSKEVAVAMERHNNKQAVVIPIFVRPCDFKNMPFSKLQGFPKDAKPVTTWDNLDLAYTDISKGVRYSIEEFLKPQ
jgi:internalin A